jgi:hypothetical protein
MIEFLNTILCDPSSWKRLGLREMILSLELIVDRNYGLKGMESNLISAFASSSSDQSSYDLAKTLFERQEQEGEYEQKLQLWKPI